MAELIIASRHQSFEDFVASNMSDFSNDLSSTCSNIAKYNNLRADSIVLPNQPILFPDDPNNFTCSGLPSAYQLTGSMTPEQGKVLSELGKMFSGDEILALAEIKEKLDGIGQALGETTNSDIAKAVSGSMLTVAKNRGDKLLTAMMAYEDALTEYKKAPHPNKQRVASSKVRPAFKRLQTEFRADIDRIAQSKPKSISRQALYDRSRAQRLLRNTNQSIELRSLTEVKRLQGFVKFARVAGPGVVVLDGILIGKKISEAEKRGEDTRRLAAVEYSGLAMGAASAMFVAAFIPGVGLALLIAAGAAASIGGSAAGKYGGGYIFDLINN